MRNSPQQSKAEEKIRIGEKLLYEQTAWEKMERVQLSQAREKLYSQKKGLPESNSAVDVAGSKGSVYEAIGVNEKSEANGR